jgi:hypothetical protein
MSFARIVCLTTVCLVGCVSLAVASTAAEIASVQVTTQQPGPDISPTMLGLSYETSLLYPRTNGVRYFRPDNKPLVRLFQTLGVKHLRIGGNSVDTAQFPIPSEPDIDSLFNFARAAGVKVIYSVRLDHGDPSSAAAIVRFIRQNHASTLESLAIGNEPSGYYKDTNIFLARWTAIHDAIRAEWPEVKFSGPDDNPSPAWCAMMVQNFGAPKGSLAQITQHSYSFGCSYQNPKEKDVTKLIPVDVPAAREKMLSPDAYQIYQKIFDGIQSAIKDTSLTYRMTEVNSYWFSGLKGASDRYAAALWGVDYLHWWAEHGADGLNFHTGDRTGGLLNLPCRYAAFVSSPKGYTVRPLGYGLMLFSLSGLGQALPTTVTATTNQNLAVYANSPEPKVACVTIINKDHGSDATAATVQIALDAKVAGKSISTILLTEQHGDIAADAAKITLGGTAISESGKWTGKWTKQPVTAGTNVITLSVPPASALLLRAKLQ